MAHSVSADRSYLSQAFKVVVALVAVVFVGLATYFAFFWQEGLDPAAKQAQIHDLLNQAAAASKAKNFAQAVVLATKAIELDDSNAEAYFRRGQGYFGVGLASHPMDMIQCERGAQDFKHANVLDPNYRAWTQEMIDDHEEAKAMMGRR